MADKKKKETGLTTETAENTKENKKSDNTKNLGVLRELGGKRKNTWPAKIKRTFTSILPVSESRKGQCVSCGACCRLPNICPFLKYGPDGKSFCSIYLIRPLNCRKYPRTKSEFITADTCGYKFE